MSTEEADRRSYVRLSPDTDVRCRLPQMEVVHVVGLSSGGTGMRVITDKPLPEGEAFEVEMEIDDQAERVACSGRVVWHESRDFDFCNRHIHGVEFQGLKEEDRRRLVALLPKE